MKKQYCLKFLLLFFLIKSNSGLFAQSRDSLFLSILGTWRYVKTINHITGKELPSQYYWFKNGYKSPIKFPLFVFNLDSTYTERFTEKNISKGHWDYQENEQLLNLHLLVDSTDWIGKDLIARKLVNKQFDGNYYEKSSYKILKIKTNELYLSSAPEPTNGAYNVEIFKRE